MIAGAPSLTDYLDEESRQHFDGLCRHLDAVGIDYVSIRAWCAASTTTTHTVFEWVTTELGSQDAVCSGGRYDGLVAQLGGEPTPAIGWALGQERIVELLRAQQRRDAGRCAPDVYLVIAGERAEAEGLALAERLRDAVPGCASRRNCGGGSFKSQLKRADKSGAASGADSGRRGNRTPRRRSEVPARRSAAGRAGLGPGRGRDRRAARRADGTHTLSTQMTLPWSKTI